jgi:hypothetical protein
MKIDTYESNNLDACGDELNGENVLDSAIVNQKNHVRETQGHQEQQSEEFRHIEK